jgi:hypothetical protein
VRIAAFLMLLSLCGALVPPSARAAPLERGLAVTDPLALRELELRAPGNDGGAALGFALHRMLDPGGAAPLTNEALFALPSMAPVRKALDDDYERYVADEKAGAPGETIGVGPTFNLQLFDRELMVSQQTRFVLAGIVNRMDRAYVDPPSCGEIRLIYRLTRLSSPSPPAGEGRGGGPPGEASTLRPVDPATELREPSTPRLPMTLNIVLKARGDSAKISCAEIARRWLATAAWPQTGADLAARLLAAGGPLELIRPENIDRIETNLQIGHAPKSQAHDFRTDYLLKVFHYDAPARTYREAPLENQFDRERLLTDPALGREFKSWLLEPQHLSELDRGTVVIPEKFLKAGAVAPTPVGFVRSNMQPAFGLVGGDGVQAPLFKPDDVVAALKQAASRHRAFENIRSVAGFERRLNDITCAGCHQTRGIGGFHFPGVDAMAEKPSNSVVVPASPHFLGDQVRRRDIVEAVAGGRHPDFSRGFSDRPQTRGATELAGTEYQDGWGAHCYQRGADAAGNDASFRGWSCAAGLSCQVTGEAVTSSRMGMCFIGNR